LLWLGYKIFRGSAQPMDFSASGMAGNRSLLKTFRDGLYTQLSNPKTALVFASIFTALLPAQIPTAFYYIVPLMSFLIDVSWYSLVALVLSADRPRRVYLRLKRRIDIATATVLGALGLRLIATSLTR
ncbi:LysE family translocator, partial [Klebsiella pneumoniae]